MPSVTAPIIILPAKTRQKLLVLRRKKCNKYRMYNSTKVDEKLKNMNKNQVQWILRTSLGGVGFFFGIASFENGKKKLHSF